MRKGTGTGMKETERERMTENKKRKINKSEGENKRGAVTSVTPHILTEGVKFDNQDHRA